MKRLIAFITPVIIMGVISAAAGEGGKITGKVTGVKKVYDHVVYVEGVAGNTPAEHYIMDQKGMEFIPHVLPIIKGGTVDFLNSDPVRHNVFTPDGEKFNLGTWPQGETKSYVFNKPGVYTMLCNVHPEMEAYIVVLDSIYFAVTDGKGTFTIEGAPDGSYTLKTWHSKYKPVTANVTVSGGKGGPVTISGKK